MLLSGNFGLIELLQLGKAVQCECTNTEKRKDEKFAELSKKIGP